MKANIRNPRIATEDKKSYYCDLEVSDADLKYVMVLVDGKSRFTRQVGDNRLDIGLIGPDDSVIVIDTERNNSVEANYAALYDVYNEDVYNAPDNHIFMPRVNCASIELYDANFYFMKSVALSPSKYYPGFKDLWAIESNEFRNAKYYRLLVRDNTNICYEHEMANPFSKYNVQHDDDWFTLIVREEVKSPKNFHRKMVTPYNFNDRIVYETSVRDFTEHSTWGGDELLAKTFRGLVQSGTEYNGLSTGFDHIVDLGVTDVQLMPVYSFEGESITGYNWGYMPRYYNTLHAAYGVHPFDPIQTEYEFKDMICKFKYKGIGVIMDVVYNHAGHELCRDFQVLAKDYFLRTREDGTLSNGSGCGNELATERGMVRKMIIDSIRGYAQMGVRGFRFDLMELYDFDTIVRIKEMLLSEFGDEYIVYGEPWKAEGSSYKGILTDKLMCQHTGIGYFNDTFRDKIKGSNGVAEYGAFIQGSTSHNSINTMKEQFVLKHDSVSYVSCHDNHTLADKIYASTHDRTDEERARMQAQAVGIVLFSSGLSFIDSGTEFLRSKNGNHNSYNDNSGINMVDWSLKERNQKTFEYIAELIKTRKDADIDYDKLSVVEFNGKPCNVMIYHDGYYTFIFANKDVEFDLPYEYTNCHQHLKLRRSDIVIYHKN